MAHTKEFLIAVLLSLICFSYADEKLVHVRYFKIKSVVYSRFATTLITSRLANPTNRSQEVRFTATLPQEAFISNFSMQIGDAIFVGNVAEKNRARRDYELAKSQGETAALVEQKARDTNSFSIDANVAAFGKVIFNLTYQEVLVRTHGAYRHVINVRSDKLVSSSDVDINVKISEKGKVFRVHVPRFSEKLSEKTNAELLRHTMDRDVKRSTVELNGTSIATIKYKVKPSKYTNGMLSSQLVVLYDVERDTGAGEIQMYDGYFVHFFAPKVLHKLNKRIVFVLDKSRSMEGTKITQTKQAMKRILRDLRPIDMFNIIVCNHEFTVRNPEMMYATEENVNQTIDYIDTIRADGGNNIYDSLVAAMNMLNSSNLDRVVPVIILLTDGEATDGTYTSHYAIVSRITEMNQGPRVVIHGLAFGNGRHFQLVQRLSDRNHGLARRIYEDADADMQLTGFYSEISSPLLSGLKFQYLNNTVDTSSLVTENQKYYYEGGEMMTVGKLASRQSQSTDSFRMMVTATAEQANEPTTLSSNTSYSFTCDPLRSNRIILDTDECPEPNRYPTQSSIADASTVAGFIERMWAYKTIKKLLNAAQLERNQTESARREVLRLSLKYGFVTEMTSMVVVQSDEENVITVDSRDGDGLRVTSSSGYPDNRSLGPSGPRQGLHGKTVGSQSWDTPTSIDLLIVVVKSDNVSVRGEVAPIIVRLLADHNSSNVWIQSVIVNDRFQPLKISLVDVNSNVEQAVINDLQNSNNVLLVDLVDNITDGLRERAQRKLIWISSTVQPEQASLYRVLTTNLSFTQIINHR